MPEHHEITTIILAGGKSTRMKTDKGLIYFGNISLIEHVIKSVKKITDHIIIVSENPAYKKFGYPCYPDVLENKGALGGIYSGLTYSSTRKNFVVGCDMPFLSENLLTSLINKCGDEEILLTEHEGRAEPLCSVYDKKCITHIRSQLEQNQLKITDVLAGLKTRVISFDKEEWFIGNEFANINSPEDVNKYKS
jgi:molybdopterin-guanine dinucleotide biosynthesis protein A